MSHWLSILPPLLVLTSAIITQNVSFSLLFGILSAAFIAHCFSLWSAIYISCQRIFFEATDPANLLTAGFLIILGIIITLMNNTGGTQAYGVMLKKWLKDSRGVKLSSIFLSFLFMIDDFFSSLTVGSVIKPLSDKFHIPRAKLAFLIDSLSAPMVIIMPMSTWLAMLLMQIQKAGVSLELSENPVILADQFIGYLHVIPFTLYSFSMLCTTLFIVFGKISYGPMKKHELIAQETGNLFGGKQPIIDKNTHIAPPEGSIIDFAFPLGSLIVCSCLAILYAGDFYLFGGKNSTLLAIQQANIFLALFVGSLIALISSTLFMYIRNKMSFSLIKIMIYEGYGLMASSIVTLLLAWTFSNMIRSDLNAGEYLAQLLTGSISVWTLPFVFYIVSLITALATGSSWGTIAVIMPIAIPMLPTFFGVMVPVDPQLIPIIYPVIGAIFSGAVAGDHVSPISPTTIMTATSASCYISDHVYTQLPYALPGLIATGIGYLIIGWMLTHTYSAVTSWCVSMALTLTLTIATLYLWNAWDNKKQS